jgi:predicted molibdopterin-dependent oxidoreductase YjgC
MVRKDGTLKAATWDEAFKAIADNLGKGEKLGAIASTRLPAEDLALFKSIFADQLGAGVVTSLEEGLATASLTALADKLGKSFESNMDALKDTDAVLALELDLVDEHEVAGFFVKRQLQNGTKLVVADSIPNQLADKAQVKLPLKAGDEAEFLKSLLAAVENGNTDADMNAAADALKNAEKPVIVYGVNFASHVNEDALETLLALAEKTGAALVGVKGKSNSMAAAQLGLESAFKADDLSAAFVILGDEEPSQKLVKALESVPFVVAQAAYSSQVTGKAAVVLPVGNWAEQSGTYLSLDGRLQKAVQSIDAPDGILTNHETLLKIAETLSVSPDMDWKASLMARVPTVAIQEA